jgi:hypothetical protein
VPYPHTTPTTTDGALCLSCGYALQGLSRDARCPECGFPVADSLHDAFVACAPPRYRQRVLSGAEFISGSLKAVVAAPLLGIIFFVFGPVGVLLATVCFVAIVGVLWFGAWQFVTPAPATLLLPPRAERHARIVRWMPLISLFVAAVCFAIAAIRFSLSWITPIAIVACVSLWCWSLLAYAAALAERLPDGYLVRHALRLRLLAALPCACVMLSTGLFHIMPRSWVVLLPGLLAPLLCVWLLAMLTSTWAADFVERLHGQTTRTLPQG